MRRPPAHRRAARPAARAHLCRGRATVRALVERSRRQAGGELRGLSERMRLIA